MSTCRRCAHPINDEYFPPGGRYTFEPFDFLAVVDSAHNPVEQEIFNRTERPEESKVQMLEKRNVDDPDFQGRPAIALDAGEFPLPGEPLCARVLLTATYWGQYKHRRDLPLILQRFGVGVYKHRTIAGEPFTFHLHTSPEWTNSSREKETNAWLIAREYPFEGNLGERGRWRNVKRVKPWSCSSFTVDEQYQTDLRQVIRDSWNDWTKDCQFDPESLETCVEDYMMFTKTLGRYRKRTGKRLPPKQNPLRNTTTTRAKVSSSQTATANPAKRRDPLVDASKAKGTKDSVQRQDAPKNMIQRTPISFAHPSLARPIATQSTESAKSNAGKRPVQVGIANDNSKLPAAAASTRPAPPVTVEAPTTVTEQTSTTQGSAAPPPPKASYAQMLKAGATSGQAAQKAPRQMVPA